MKAVGLLATVLSALVLFNGSAYAEYQSDQDVTVAVEVAPEFIETEGTTGEATFLLQEEVHEQLTTTSGESVDHYYIWIEVNGEPLLAVDPLWVEYD